MEKIRDCLDEGRDFEFEGSTTAIFSVCETLLRLLDALPEPIVPFGMYQRCVDSYQSYQLAKQAVSQIPTVHYNVFVYLTAFLREVISHSSANGLTAENLGKFDIFSDLNLHSLHFGPLFFFFFLLFLQLPALIFSAVLLRSPKTVSEKYRDVVGKKKSAFLMHFLNTTGESI